MAAGAATRMGAIKQLLPWKSSNLLLESINTIQKCKCGSVHVVLGANAIQIKKECRLEAKGVTVVVNQNWSAGLGNSIGYGVKKVLEVPHSPDGILVCLADQPLLTANYFDSLITTFNSEFASRIIATNYGNKAGVPALFPTSFYPELLTLQGDKGAKELLEAKKNELIMLRADGQLIDIDTKKEYQQIKQNIHDNEK